ncbi:hypothetical protein [Citrobacter meridianamericanus]|uniref:hypothetical protein n=1 Tax=Citrobacter meridianamericanus TaxID=2894201 RepID=UPI00351D4DD4
MTKIVVHYAQYGKMESGTPYASMNSSSLKFSVKDNSAGYRANKVNIDTSNDNALGRRLVDDLKAAGRPVIIDAELEQVDSKEIAKYALVDYELLSSTTEIIPSLSPVKDKSKEQPSVK